MERYSSPGTPEEWSLNLLVREKTDWKLLGSRLHLWRTGDVLGLAV